MTIEQIADKVRSGGRVDAAEALMLYREAPTALLVPIDGGHPGWVYAHRSKLILRNTDEHGEFRQYLKTSRMGSTIFAPIVWVANRVLKG
mgnify:CR=1 FL=1